MHFHFRFSDSRVRLGPDNSFFVAGGLLTGIQAAYVAVHPIYNGAVGIVVQAVHTGAADAAVRQYGVPAFPDSGGSHFYFIQPAWKIVVEKQGVGNLIVTIFREDPAQEGGAAETGIQMHVFGFQPFLQLSGHPFLGSVGIEPQE